MGKTILTNTQRLTLQTLSYDPIVSAQFYLTGGTALAEFYLQHRLSEDLDFFSQQEIDILWLTTLSKKIMKAIDATKMDNQQSFNRNLIFFTKKREILKTEFTYFPFPPIEKPSRQQGLLIDSITDIAVNKFFTIYQKPASRHFIDLYSIVQKKYISWETLPKLARIKFDTVIDPIQLGSQLIAAETIGQLPDMLIPLNEKAWRSFFIEKAKGLRSQIS